MLKVRDEGSLKAKIVLVGEAPGKHEMAAGRPFVGPSGGRLAVWWRQVGLCRDDFYITNVLDYLPEDINKVPQAEMEAAIEALHLRLEALEDPWLIVPTGNYALYALTKKGKVSWHKKDGRLVRPGIKDWRGSILTTGVGDRQVKVIPTIHPAAILREPGLERKALTDWKRIAEEAQSPVIAVPHRIHRIKPNVTDVLQYVEEAIAFGGPLALDIETPKGKRTEYQMLDGSWSSHVKKTEADQVARYKSGKKKGQLKSRTRPGKAYLGCIGFSYDPHISLTIPMTKEYWKNPDDYVAVKAAVYRLLASELPKVMQNGMFDSVWLLSEGFVVNNWLWDTRAMHHALDPRDDHDLAYMASVYTRQPFWKHEAKDPEEITKYASNSEALWTYNGIDCCVTLELFKELRQRLKDAGLLSFYLKHYANVMPILLDMTRHGIRVDDDRRACAMDELNNQAGELIDKIEAAAGMSLIAKKGLSNDRLKFLLYGRKGFEGKRAEATFTKLAKAYPAVEPMNLQPLRKKNAKNQRTVTVEEIALRKLILKYPAKLGTLGPLLLEYRRNCKKREFLDGKAVDADRRMRCMYSFITEAGRLASQKTPWGTGRNLQNIDRELRYVFVPDEEVLNAKVSSALVRDRVS